MDDINVPRSLYYKERSTLYDFLGPGSAKSLESQFLKALKRRSFIKRRVDAPEYVLKIFNNAYYICTLIYFESEPALYIGRYKNIAANNQETSFWEEQMMPATMALVYNWVNTSWYRKEKDMGDGAVEALDEFLIDLYDDFREWDVIGMPEGKDNFFTLILEKDIYEPNMKKENYIVCRLIEEAIEDSNVPIQDIAGGIDYIFDMLRGEESHAEYYILMKTMNRIDKESSIVKDADKLEYAKNKVKRRLHELGHWTEESDMNIIEPLMTEKAFNAVTGNECFSKAKIGLLIYSIASLTDGPTPIKAQLVPIIAAIGGWEEKSVNSEMKKAGFNPSDIDAVAKVFENAMPRFADEIKKQIPRRQKIRK